MTKKQGCKIRGQPQLLGLHAGGPHRKGMSSSLQHAVWLPSLVSCMLNQMQFYNSAEGNLGQDGFWKIISYSNEEKKVFPFISA